jgi:hypothetical protein
MRTLRAYTWSTQLAPQVPWISAVQRAICNLRAEILDQLYPRSEST